MQGNIGIIGASCNGVSVLGNIVRNTLSSVDSITLIDPRAPGGGPIFNPESPLLLCNTSAGTQSFIAQDQDDFLEYLAHCGRPASAEAYVPRDLVGEYTRARYQQYVDLAASRGVKVTHDLAQATSVQRRGDGSYEVRLNDDLPQQFDRVVVCTGFGAPKIADAFAQYTGHARFVTSPFPAPHLRRRIARQDSRVLVLGTGQSAVDAAVLLCSDGHQVTMVSRSGVLPAVRNRFVPPPVALPSLARTTALDPDDPLLGQKVARIVVEAIRVIAPIPLRQQLSTAIDPVRRLREEVELLDAGRCGWQDILFPLVDELIAWTAGLPLATQASLLSSFRPVWRFITAMSSVNAERLLRFIDAGQLRISSYDPSRVVAHSVGFDVGVHHHGIGRFDYVVNCTGFQFPRLYVDAQTIYLTDPPATATVLDHLERDLRVRLSPGAPPENMWLVGQTTIIHTPFPHFLPLVAVQAGRVAQQLVTI